MRTSRSRPRCRWWAAISLSVVLAGTAGLLPARAQQKILIRLSTGSEVDSLFQRTAEEFARRLAKESGGSVEVRLIPGDQAGSEEELLRTLRSGSVEMFLPSTILSAVDDGFGVFEVPFLVVDRAHMKRLADSRELRQILFEPLALKGLRPLAFWENGFRQMTNNVRPISRPEDLRGLKIRIPRSVWRQRLFQLLGATPVPITYAEVYRALQAGVVDGQENPLPTIWSGKFYEVQKFLSLTGHVYTPAYPTVGERWWRSLAPETRKVIRKVANDVSVYAWEEGERLDKSQIQAMMKANPNLKVNDADRRAFLATSAVFSEQFAKEVSNGATLIRLVQSLRPSH